MNCNKELHNGLSDIGEISCPFCEKILDSNEKPKDRLIYDLCCDCQYIINDNGMLVCKSCGIVQGYETAREYVDFYENKYRMKRKSVYNRKYHVNNILMDIASKYKMTYSVEQKNKIMRIISEIGKIFSQINGERKRMISINFILRKVLSMMNLPFDNIQISE